MTRQQAIEKLTVTLTKAIEEWSEAVSQEIEWESLKIFAGEDTERLMAKAAIAVLEAVSEAQDYALAESHFVVNE